MMVARIGGEIGRLLRSDDPDDRAFGAFSLTSERDDPDAIAALTECLSDSSADVVGYAAQALALQGHLESLPRLVTIMASQPGDVATSVAWAVATLASVAPREEHDAAWIALEALSKRGNDEVVEQVRLLQEKRQRYRE